jgi:hypothetical protein
MAIHEKNSNIRHLANIVLAAACCNNLTADDLWGTRSVSSRKRSPRQLFACVRCTSIYIGKYSRTLLWKQQWPQCSVEAFHT